MAGGSAARRGFSAPGRDRLVEPALKGRRSHGLAHGVGRSPHLRWLLPAAATAPFGLAWIILRGHALSWARGEMTVVTSIAAFGLIADNGFVDRPGDIAISLRLGLLAALAATVVMVGAAAKRSSESERPRKPPGTTWNRDPEAP